MQFPMRRRALVTLMGCTASWPAVNKVLDAIQDAPAAGHAEQTPFEQEA